MLREVARQAPGYVLADRLVPRSLAGKWYEWIVLMSAAIALVALAAQVRILLPFTPVPLTGQTFAVLLVGASLGALRGTVALGLYLVAGIAGVPVFNGWESGPGHVLGPTGGYLVGFIAAAGILGYLAERHVDRRILTALPGMLVASLVIYAFGISGLLIVGLSLPDAIGAGVVPFIGGDILKASLAAVVLPGAWWLVNRIEDNG